MAQATVIEALLKERDRLIAERVSTINRLDFKIGELEVGIEILSGKKVWEVEAETHYDDEQPDYIKGSEDGI